MTDEEWHKDMKEIEDRYTMFGVKFVLGWLLVIIFLITISIIFV